MLNIIAIIPARYQSTRFPGKPLVDINGKSMIQRVFEQAKKAQHIKSVYIATDDDRIINHVNSFTQNVIKTSSNHTTGTDRINEAVKEIKEHYDFIINIQGDEPFIDPLQIDTLANSLNKEIQIATLIKKITDEETLFNSNTPKVIFNKYFQAIYFSRQTIPYIRDQKKENWLSNYEYYKHIGIYAYRNDILPKLAVLEPSILEKAESLEQLRWIENGYKINVTVTDIETFGIDTPEDLLKIK